MTTHESGIPDFLGWIPKSARIRVRSITTRATAGSSSCKLAEEAKVTIAWTTDLNTGIDVIDQQHRKIVDYINQLETCNRLNDRRVIGQVLTELVDYTVSHFAFEEKLQTDVGYKLAGPHKSIHELFIRRVSKYRQRYDAGEDVAGQLHSMLKTWLVHHIKRDDSAYVSSVKPSITRLIEDRSANGWVSRAIAAIFGHSDDAPKH